MKLVSDSTRNPYAPPSVPETAHESGHETLFVHRVTSRNIWAIVGSVPILLCTFVALGNAYTVFSDYLLYKPSNREIAFCLSMSGVFVGLSAFVIAGFVVPRVWEFQVNRQFVSWRVPWPNASEHQVQVASIDRVEYRGNALAIVTLEGECLYPPVYTYGGSVEPVIAAITLAVRDRAPQTVVRERKTVESVSLMRRLGQLIGAISRMFRSH